LLTDVGKQNFASPTDVNHWLLTLHIIQS